MREIIKITSTKIGQGNVNAVDARELHSFIRSRQDFSTWVKGRIAKYEFVEGTDFIQFHKFVESDSRPRIEYAISIDMAKELAMVENNDQGKMARKYFIKCERDLKAAATPRVMTRLELIQLAMDSEIAKIQAEAIETATSAAPTL